MTSSSSVLVLYSYVCCEQRHFTNSFLLLLQAVELLRRSAATATLVIERYRQPQPEVPPLEDVDDLLRTSVIKLAYNLLELAAQIGGSQWGSVVCC